MKWTELYFKIQIISGIILTIAVLLYCVYNIISYLKYKKKIKSKKEK